MDTEIDSTYDRVNVATLFAAFGGLTYTLRSIFNGINYVLSDFSVDKSMMRRLYAADKHVLDDDTN